MDVSAAVGGGHASEIYTLAIRLTLIPTLDHKAGISSVDLALPQISALLEAAHSQDEVTRTLAVGHQGAASDARLAGLDADITSEFLELRIGALCLLVSASDEQT
jgi:hypothetical protein